VDTGANLPSSALVPSGFFIIRSSLLPVESFLQWGEGIELAADFDSEEGLEKAWQQDSATLRNRLHEIMRQPEIREALFIASPGFESRFEARTLKKDGKKEKRYERALVRYLARMSGRATPLGLLAGCTFGTVGTATRLEVSAREHYRRHTRIDIDFLSELIDELYANSDVRHELGLTPNSSLFSIAGHFHYVAGQKSGHGYSYAPVSVEHTMLLQALLQIAGRGTNLTALAGSLCQLVPAVPEEKAKTLIRNLVEQQILVPSCLPVITGEEALDRLIGELDVHVDAKDIVATLSEVRHQLREIDIAPGASPESYRRIAAKIEALPGNPDTSRLFQVDLIKPGVVTSLGDDVLDEIASGIQWLHGWFGPGYQDPLQTFRMAFRERYGDREVRLVEALDEEVGIGSRAFDSSTDSSPLLEDLPLPDVEVPRAALDIRHETLLQRLGKALEDGEHEIRMTHDDLHLLQSVDGIPAIPDALAVKGSLAAPTAEQLARGEFRFSLDGAMGPPATILLGRHCQADENLRAAVEKHLRRDAARTPDAIFAEIVYSPKGRLGNIQARPVLSDYEIPYLGRSALPEDRQIPVDDLLVSARTDEVVLRSARLGKRVIPRMSSAHNFRRDEIVTYRFLCSLQIQGVCWWLRWDWGALSGARFLPRVSLGRLVLSPATWNLDPVEISCLSQHAGAKRFAAVRKWRVARRIPRYVVLIDADEKLLCDLDNLLSTETFIELIKDQNSATLEEMFPSAGELAVSGPEGRFVHELVIPFECPSARKVASNVPTTTEGDGIRRSKLPGRDWLYVKIYSGPVTADQLLREFDDSFVSLIDTDAVRHWFFVRYADPDLHLRLRFKGDPAYLQRELYPQLNEKLEALQRKEMLWRVVVDTYEQEVERYGGPAGMALAERLFHADSLAALAVVASCQGDIGADARWRLALKGIDMLFDDFEMPLDARARQLGELRALFSREFQADHGPLKQGLGQKFRRERESIRALLDENAPSPPAFEAGIKALHQRSALLRPVAALLMTSHERGELSCSIETLLASYIHMQCNRMLRWPHRRQEMAMYDLLGRHYDSQFAQLRRDG
jgi:thiopeptide-type bacteriocin biosynthesis protein